MDFTGRDEIVKRVQKHLGLKVDGQDGPKTWEAISNSLLPKEQKQEVPQSSCELSPKALDLIIKHEVGGGESYYNKALKNPTWPEGQSGVTIGIGYDLGYNSLDQFTKDWKGKISDQDFNKLATTLGKKSENAKVLVAGVKGIVIPWNVALEVFKNSTLPRFIEETKKAFPQSDKLHPNTFGALVSLVFNRGGSTTGDSRREMLNIRQATSGAIKVDDVYTYIADQIRSMKRLWANKGLNGLLVRRDDEARLVESSLSE